MKHLILLHTENVKVLNKISNSISLSEKSDDYYLVFDDECSFCNSCVSFLHSIDKQKKIKLVSQTTLRNSNKEQHIENIQSLESVLLIHHGKRFVESEAILESLRIVGGRYKFFIIFRVIPLSVRNGLYRLIANNRYFLSKTCRIK